MDMPYREMRTRRHLSLEDVADLAGVPLEIVRDIEAGVEEVGLEDIRRIHQTLKTSPSLTKVGLNVIA